MFQYLKHLSRFFVSFLIVCYFSFSACRKKDQTPERGVVLSFIIEAGKNNALLNQDIAATIEVNKIVLPVPRGILLNNVHITCKFKGDTLYINNVVLDTAGKQEINNNTVLTIRTRGGGRFDYKIVLNEYEDPELVISAYSVEKSKNPELRTDVHFEIMGDTIYGRLDPDHPGLIPTFSSISQSVHINGTVQNEPVSAVNFNGEVVYSLASSKGFKKNYFIKISWNKKVAIPHLYIITEGNADITSKNNYLQADISIDGRNIYSDYTGTTRIKVRGNST